MMQAELGLFHETSRTPPTISIERQAARIATIILGKRSALERFSAPGRQKWPDAELDRLRETIAELEAAHKTLRDLIGQGRQAA